MSIKIRNWHKFQHFKDRKPPWVKLYRDILDDISWHNLCGDAAKTLVMLWLIASEHDGYLPSFKELAFRLRTTEKSIKSDISKLSTWLEQDDINVISDIKDDNAAISSGYQENRLETETETETEKRQNIGPSPLRGNGSDPTPVVEKIPLNDGTEYEVHQSLVSELDRLYPSVDPLQTLKEIRGWCIGNPAKRKTVRGVDRFIVSWFAREQDKHG